MQTGVIYRLNLVLEWGYIRADDPQGTSFGFDTQLLARDQVKPELDVRVRFSTEGRRVTTILREEEQAQRAHA